METLKERILYLREVKRLSFYQIEVLTGISRKRAARIYRGCSKKNERQKRGSLLDGYRPLILNWFSEYPSLKALQVYLWLKERGVKVSYPRVAQYTKELRRKKEKVYHQLDFLPGEEAQVDWCFINHPSLGKLCCFALILSYSRFLFARLFSRSSFEFFIEGHLMAFSSLKGYPHGLRYDNLKSVVLRRRPELEYNPRFLAFCRHYGFEIHLCNPACGNEKGRVERVIRTMRGTFFNNMAGYCSLGALNRGLRQWVDDKNRTIHRTTGKRPLDMLSEEKLKPLPRIAWNNVSIHPPVKTSKTAMMTFDTNSYSVPDYLTGKSLSVHSSPSTVKIYDPDKEVASHPRSFERHKTIVNPLHRSCSRLSTKAKMQRIHALIKNMHPAMADFFLKNQGLGEDPAKTAYEIFKLLKSHSRGMLISAACECVRRRSPRLRTYLSYLNLEPQEKMDTVLPQNTRLLNITYQARKLEEYDDQSE
jgi:transposase